MPLPAPVCYSQCMSDSPWSWLGAQADALEGMGPEAAAEVFNTELRKLDPRLEVEVADAEGRRHVVISANGTAELFATVDGLVESAPRMPAWKFIALRPGRGFEFQFEAGGRIDARALSFDARKTDAGIALRLLVPNPEFEGWADIAPQIIEAGIGERATATLASIEVSKREPEDHARALETLEGYLQRNAGR